MVDHIALIPARGGSQRIPRKNIREFLGVPALTRVVHTLITSGTVQRVIVTTDDAEISEVARNAGAETPFQRPAELADAFTGARPVIQHGINALGLNDATRVGVFYPTAVLLTVNDVRESALLLDADECDFVLSVAEFPAPVERALSLDGNHMVHPRNPEHVLTRSQDLKAAYHDIGQFYWGTAGAWRADGPVVQRRCRAFVIDAWRAVDIDTPADWQRAEVVHRMLNERR